MRTLLIALLLGGLAVAIALSVAGLVLGIVAQNGDWSSFRVAIGPVVHSCHVNPQRGILGSGCDRGG